MVFIIKENTNQIDVPDKFDDDYSASSKILTTPAVRRLAMEHKINLKDVTGTGKDSRILKEDVLNYINMAKHKLSGEAKATFDHATTVATNHSAVSFSAVHNSTSSSTPKSMVPSPQANFLEDRVQPIRGITKSMFKTMTQSLNVPHFGLSEEIDLTELVRLRPEMKRVASEKNLPLSFMPFMIKAASLALTEFPILNASIDQAGENIIFKSAHNIGIAMDTKQGLLVPNIKFVNQLNVIEIAQELARLQDLGNKGQLGTENLTGGTFTLSNIGSVSGHEYDSIDHSCLVLFLTDWWYIWHSCSDAL